MLQMKIDFKSFVEPSSMPINDNFFVGLITGLQGSGKSSFAIYNCERNFKNKIIITNIQSYKSQNNYVIHFKNLNELYKIEELLFKYENNKIILNDEIYDIVLKSKNEYVSYGKLLEITSASCLKLHNELEEIQTNETGFSKTKLASETEQTGFDMEGKGKGKGGRSSLSLDLSNVVYIVDELSKRFTKNSPQDLLFYSWLQQSRKHHRFVYLITQEYIQVPNWLRGVANQVYTTKKLFKDICRTSLGYPILDKETFEWSIDEYAFIIYKRSKKITDLYNTYEFVNEL